jgi:Trypsin
VEGGVCFQEDDFVRTCVLATAAACVVGALTPAIRAEVIGTDPGNQTTSTPVSATGVTLTGYANVGVMTYNVGLNNVGASGVYIGNGWVLTATHVGAGPISFDGGSTYYQWDGQYSDQIYLTNPDGSTSELCLFKLSSANPYPNLPNISLPTAEPTTGEEMYSVGYGLGRTGSLVYYNVTGSGSNTTWTSVSTFSSANEVLYNENLGYGTKLWGNNAIAEAPTEYYNIFDGDNVIGFVSQFYEPGKLALGGDTEEQQIADGDSGGGVFNDAGQLIGMNDAEGDVYDNQPGNTAAYGDISLYGDIYSYESQIESITGVPEPTCASVSVVAFVAAFLRRRRSSPSSSSERCA